jgi:hypothetical protein
MKKIDISKRNEYLQKILSFKKYSNYFGQSFDADDLYLESEHTFILAKPVGNFFRLFLSSDDRDNALSLLKSVEGINVINFPSKKDISEWQQFMADAGCENIAIYERYFYSQPWPGGTLDQIRYAKPEQAEAIYDLLYGYEGFSPYTDYLPARDELNQLIKDGFVIVNELSGQVTGALLYSIEGKKCYLRMWIDKNQEDGSKLLFDMHTIMREKGITYTYFWVNSKNKKVKAIHRFLGAEPDGLKDYTFLKNEMIK